MGGQVATVKKYVTDLKDYTNTIAAAYLLKEVLEGRAAITHESAGEIVNKENLGKDPQIGHVIQAMLELAGKPGESQAKWGRGEDQKWHFKAAMTLDGAVYTLDIVEEPETESQQNYTLKIISTLEKKHLPGRGKLFFDDGNQASVKLIYK